MPVRGPQRLSAHRLLVLEAALTLQRPPYSVAAAVDRYAEFDLAVMPYPGVEWFSSVRNGDASAVVC